ncbi:MAG: hypothetical protein IT371_03895 [Deltaproteobacteria bacterium]|nr:hypothetical protein [Deltaproteobacteria bacterium]
MRSRRALGWIGVLLAVAALPSVVQARSSRQTQGAPVTIRGAKVAVELDGQHVARLNVMRGRLARAGVSAYLNIFKWTNAAAGAAEGATLVGAVNQTNMGRWLEEVGAHSIGFMNDGTPFESGGSGYLRIGKRFWPYGTIQGNGTASGMPRDVEWNTSSEYTEATFEASPAEIAAATAYCTARSYHLFKDKRGGTIAPSFDSWNRSGFKTEGCAGAASSMLSPAWREAFRRSLPGIQAFAAEHPEIAELHGISSATVDALDAFATRIGARQWTSPKYLTTKNYALSTVAMITAFNAYSYDTNYDEKPVMDAISDIVWSSEYRTIGGGAKTIPDLPAGKRSGAFVNERLPLSGLAAQLRSAN